MIFDICSQRIQVAPATVAEGLEHLDLRVSGEGMGYRTHQQAGHDLPLRAHWQQAMSAGGLHLDGRHTTYVQWEPNAERPAPLAPVSRTASATDGRRSMAKPWGRRFVRLLVGFVSGFVQWGHERRTRLITGETLL